MKALRFIAESLVINALLLSIIFSGTILDLALRGPVAP